MGRKFIDISVPFANDLPADPPGYELRIDYRSHRDTLPILLGRYDGLTADQLPNGEAFALEQIALSSHNGTHVDAPWHYGSTMEDGTPAPTIDEMPLDWFFRPAVKLDFRALPDGYIVRSDDIRAELERIGYRLNPLDIVLVNTSAGSHFGEPDYYQRGCGIGREATLFLTSQGIRVAGIDSWSWDAPYKYMAEAYERTGDAGLIWEGHRAGLRAPYCQIEKLHNLECLPPFGFSVSCFPVKIRGGSAGWTRAVAIIDESSTSGEQE